MIELLFKHLCWNNLNMSVKLFTSVPGHFKLFVINVNLLFTWTAYFLWHFSARKVVNDLLNQLKTLLTTSLSPSTTLWNTAGLSWRWLCSCFLPKIAHSRLSAVANSFWSASTFQSTIGLLTTPVTFGTVPQRPLFEHWSHVNEQQIHTVWGPSDHWETSLYKNTWAITNMFGPQTRSVILKHYFGLRWKAVTLVSVFFLHRTRKIDLLSNRCRKLWFHSGKILRFKESNFIHQSDKF